MQFAAVIIQSKFVGFYFMPIRFDKSLDEKLGKDLMALKKRGSCFNIKSLDKSLEKQIKDALKLGHLSYKKSGWI